jgi:hypothetical protein
VPKGTSGRTEVDKELIFFFDVNYLNLAEVLVREARGELALCMCVLFPAATSV